MCHFLLASIVSDDNLIWCSPIGKVLFTAFNTFFIISLQTFNYDVSFFAFIQFGFHSASWMCRFVYFIKFGKFLDIISLNTVSALPSLFLKLWWYKCWIFCYCSTGLWGSVHSYLFILVYFLCCSDCVNSICPQVHWFYPLSSPLCYWVYTVSF